MTGSFKRTNTSFHHCRITSYEYDIYRVGGNINIYSECYIGFQLDADGKLNYMLTINGGWKLHFILAISSVRLFSLFNLLQSSRYAIFDLMTDVRYLAPECRGSPFLALNNRNGRIYIGLTRKLIL